MKTVQMPNMVPPIAKKKQRTTTKLLDTERTEESDLEEQMVKRKNLLNDKLELNSELSHVESN